MADGERIPGWYVDAMEQNLGALISMQAQFDHPVEDFVELLSDPSSEDGSAPLTHDQHVQTLALLVAICVRRLARVAGEHLV